MVKFSDIFNDPGRRKDDATKARSSGGMDFSSLFDRDAGAVSAGTNRMADPVPEKVAQDDHGDNVSDEGLVSVPVPVRLLYDKACELVARVFDDHYIIRGEDFDAARIVTDEALAYVRHGTGQLIACVFDRERERLDDFFVRNAVNVLILSLETAVALDYPDKRIRRLGVAALMHEVGMREYRELMCKTRVFTPAEREEVRGHVDAGVALIDKVDDVDAIETATVLRQTHERIDGNGYPYGLREHMIHEHALIIGMTDVYEAVTHVRPYRAASCALAGMKMLIEGERRFAVKPLKAFLERIGLYPCGTRVELNTRETAVVVGQNPKMPSCPVVMVVYNGRGERTEPQRRVDLSKGTRIYIVKSL